MRSADCFIIRSNGTSFVELGLGTGGRNQFQQLGKKKCDLSFLSGSEGSETAHCFQKEKRREQTLLGVLVSQQDLRCNA